MNIKFSSYDRHVARENLASLLREFECESGASTASSRRTSRDLVLGALSQAFRCGAINSEQLTLAQEFIMKGRTSFCWWQK